MCVCVCGCVCVCVCVCVGVCVCVCVCVVSGCVCEYVFMMWGYYVLVTQLTQVALTKCSSECLIQHIHVQ